MVKISRPFLIALAGSILVLVTVNCQFASQLAGPATTAPNQPVASQLPAATKAAANPTAPAGSPAPQSPSEPAPTEETTPQSSAGQPGEAPAQAAGPCAEEVCIEPGTFYLARPIAKGGRDSIDYANRFGSFQSRTREAAHGVFFLNSSGTPVLAAADGVVVAAGDDSKTIYALRANTYGNLVILKHEFPGLDQPVFSLYAHLSQVSVKVKDAVKAGQEIGLVGMSGRVTGSTLDFEVRLGENTFQTVRNPELWLAPLEGDNGEPNGVLAGRVVDAQGKDLVVHNIVVEQLGGPGQPVLDSIYLKTYSETRLVGLDPWQESFAVGDLKPGSYQISFWMNGLQQRVVQIKPGKLTLTVFQIK